VTIVVHWPTSFSRAHDLPSDAEYFTTGLDRPERH
jgi:hypothetical protein